MRSTEFLESNWIAHRGYYNEKEGIPENSLPAFERAVKYNLIIELDVHVLKDGTVVVFHDDNLNRMTGVNKALKNCTYSEIKKLTLLDTNYKIPLLEEVLMLVDKKVPLLIELKIDTKVGVLESAIMNILRTYKGKYAIQSFNPFSLLWFKRNNPNIIRGQLSANFKNDKMFFLKKFTLKNLGFNVLTNPDFVSYAINALPNKNVENFRKKKLVLGWTVRNKEQFEKGKKYCDNLICENFEILDITLKIVE